MGHIEIKRSVVFDHYSEDDETLRAYSYDASGREERPLCVVRPSSEEEIRRVLQAANNNRLAVIARGSGTGSRGAVVKENAVVLDMRRFSDAERVETDSVTVGAGMTCAELERLLAANNLFFPLLDAHPLATLGGLASENRTTIYSHLFGDWKRNVLSLECFDGLGRYHTLKGDEVARVVGWEGTMGVILQLRLRVYPRSFRKTMTMIKVKDAAEAAERAQRYSGEKGVLLVEYLDATCSQLCGLEAAPHLVVGFANDRGPYKDAVKIEELLSRRSRLDFELWGCGFTLSEDVALDPSKAGQFEELCRKEGVPCFGHVADGVMLTCLKDQGQRARILNGAIALGGKAAGKRGYGRTKKEYVPQELRRAALHLKEDRDYKHIMNPGVIV